MADPVHTADPLVGEVSFPTMYRVRQRFEGPEIRDPEEAVVQSLRAFGLAAKVRPGQRIAVGVGSRGLASLPEMVRGMITVLHEAGAQPVIVPAMGSHGGATAEGQRAVLADYGVSEERLGVPIDARMDTRVVATLSDGTPVHVAEAVLSADGVVLLNRIKPHTDFRGERGSGLQKMLAIGFGKEAGALKLHAFGAAGLRERVPQAAELIAGHLPILAGVAVVENAHDRVAEIVVAKGADFAATERELCRKAAELMPRLPVDALDVLVVDALGKEISGTGMDTNVIGRLFIAGEAEFKRPRISRIAVLDLTAASHGNAVGVGLADVTTERLVAKIDRAAFYKNVITSGFLERGRIPLAMPSDREAVALALASCWQPYAPVRMMRIRNTAHLDELYASEALVTELGALPNIEILGRAEDALAFDEAGNLF